MLLPLLDVQKIRCHATADVFCMRSMQHGRGERLERCAVNTLRFAGALLARPAVRSNHAAIRTLLPPLLRPILELLPGSGCAAFLCLCVMQRPEIIACHEALPCWALVMCCIFV